MKIIAALTTLLWLSCHAQKSDVDIHQMLQNTIDILLDLKEKMSALEDQNQQIRNDISKHNELLPSLEKCSGFLDFIESQKDECNDASHKCSEFAQCIDTAFGYECSCLEGYTGDGFRCDDINECHGDICHPEAECQNSVGNYSCDCKKPYVGDGYTSCELNCQDSFGGVMAEDLGCLTLVKTYMPWEDAKTECLTRNMTLIEDIPSRQHFRLLWNAFNDYYNAWIGAKGGKWITSGDTIKPELYAEDQPDGGSEECIYFVDMKTAGEDEGFYDYYCTVTNYPLCQSFLPSQ